MQRLFLFLYQYRAFLLFAFLELFSAWLIVRHNQYQGAAFLNSSNRLAANILRSKQNINNYFGLGVVNKTLAEENALLREMIASGGYIAVDSAGDSTVYEREPGQFDFQVAQVINNSTRRASNYITINKGTSDGIEPDMAVVNSQGIVGKVKVASRHFATVISLLHPDFYVSSLIKRSGTLCTTKWGGPDPQVAELLYVPRHLQVQPGDTIVTSGYNAIFPPQTMIGVIKSVDISEDATFYDIDIDLATDFEALSYVYVVKNNAKGEIDSLEQETYSIK